MSISLWPKDHAQGRDFKISVSFQRGHHQLPDEFCGLQGDPCGVAERYMKKVEELKPLLSRAKTGPLKSLQDKVRNLPSYIAELGKILSHRQHRQELLVAEAAVMQRPLDQGRVNVLTQTAQAVELQLGRNLSTYQRLQGAITQLQEEVRVLEKEVQRRQQALAESLDEAALQSHARLPRSRSQETFSGEGDSFLSRTDSSAALSDVLGPAAGRAKDF